jgi:hypothetical protein
MGGKRRKKRKKRVRNDDEEEEDVALGDRPRVRTMIGTLRSRAKSNTVVEAVRLLAEANDKLVMLLNDAMHLYVVTAITRNEFDMVGDLGEQDTWTRMAQMVYNSGKNSEKEEQAYLKKLNVIEREVYKHFRGRFSSPISLHKDLLESLATKEATNYTQHVTLDNVRAHLSGMLRGKLQVKQKSWTDCLARSITHKDEDASYKFPDGLIKEVGERILTGRHGKDHKMNKDEVEQVGEQWCEHVVREESHVFHLIVGNEELADGASDHVKKKFFTERRKRLAMYHLYLLEQCDAADDKTIGKADMIKCKRFSLIPKHACGSSHFVDITKSTMWSAIRSFKMLCFKRIKELKVLGCPETQYAHLPRHIEYCKSVIAESKEIPDTDWYQARLKHENDNKKARYEKEIKEYVAKIKSYEEMEYDDDEEEEDVVSAGQKRKRAEKPKEPKAPKFRETPAQVSPPLSFYFDDSFYFKSKKEGIERERRRREWQMGRTVRSNGYELQTIFEKNMEYNSQGKPLPCCSRKQVKPEMFDLPIEVPEACKKMSHKMIAGVDPGKQTLLTATRIVRYEDGAPVYETRKVSGKWFDSRSGRLAMRRRSRHLTKVAQNKGLMEGITRLHVNTADVEKLVQAIDERFRVHKDLHKVFSNMRSKRQAFCMRIRATKAIQEMIRYITWDYHVALAIGDCSKLSNFRGAQMTPGGPMTKVYRLMVQMGLPVWQVQENYTSKMSSCCPGHEVRLQDNGQNPETYRVPTKERESPWLIKRSLAESSAFELASKRTPSYPNKIHGITICNKCGKTWCRDKNAAINIWTIAMVQIRGKPRPAHLCAPPSNQNPSSSDSAHWTGKPMLDAGTENSPVGQSLQDSPTAEVFVRSLIFL